MGRFYIGPENRVGFDQSPSGEVARRANVERAFQASADALVLRALVGAEIRVLLGRDISDLPDQLERILAIRSGR